MQCIPAGVSNTNDMQLTNKLSTPPAAIAAAPRALPCRVCGVRVALPKQHRFASPKPQGSQPTRRAAWHVAAASAVAETAMETVTVDLGDRSYPIYIGSGILNTPEKLLAKHIKGKQVLIVTNETIAPLYLDAYVGGG